MKKYPKQGFCLPTEKTEKEIIYCKDRKKECEFKTRKESKIKYNKVLVTQEWMKKHKKILKEKGIKE